MKRHMVHLVAVAYAETFQMYCMNKLEHAGIENITKKQQLLFALNMRYDKNLHMSRRLKKGR